MKEQLTLEERAELIRNKAVKMDKETLFQKTREASKNYQKLLAKYKENCHDLDFMIAYKQAENAYFTYEEIYEERYFPHC